MTAAPPGRAVDDAEALRISNAIDEDLKREREVMRKRHPREVKVMLLGQAESGKSTLQKQFQLYYASQTLDKERPRWRPLVYFNILKAIRMVLSELDNDYFPAQDPASFPEPHSRSRSSTPPGTSSRTPSSDTRREPAWFPELPQLRSKLLPLVASEDALASDLNGGITVSGGRTGVFVRAGWQAFDAPARAWPLSDIRNVPARPSAMTDIVAKTLAASQDEIEELWLHPVVKELVAGNRLRLDECAAFFLDNIRRIAQADYLPTTDDILHVRLQTLGVIEHSFEISMAGVQYHWLLYDVGGARQAWVPYFEDATAIIFLAPISAFNQYLEEDPRTNRIDDSLQLFTTICSNKLLQKATLVLMLNKTDLLKKKIQAGVKVRKYISSFGDRPNTYEEVSEYFRAHFIQAHKRKDVSHRQLFLHFTSMIDVRTTQNIIVNVNEAILRKHMTTIGLA
ncbi:G-protein alpha subunit [Amylocystis lapponica]|nr:G-protein alpha subunit [Amylocystis lapponica]